MINNGEILISVCIATFNGAKYIEQQLDSIIKSLAFSKYNWEVLVSDDGSTDSTLEIVNKFVGRNVRVVNGPKKGPAKNFEYLLNLSVGTFVFFSDQDDIWSIDRVKLTIPLLYDNDLVVCNGAIVDEYGKTMNIMVYDIFTPSKSIIRNIFSNSFVGAALAFRRDATRKFNIFPNGIMHDVYIGICFLICGKVIFTDLILFKYRRHATNLTSLRDGYNITYASIIYRLKLIFSILRFFSLRLFRVSK